MKIEYHGTDVLSLMLPRAFSHEPNDYDFKIVLPSVDKKEKFHALINEVVSEYKKTVDSHFELTESFYHFACTMGNSRNFPFEQKSSAKKLKIDIVVCDEASVLNNECLLPILYSTLFLQKNEIFYSPLTASLGESRW